MDAHTTRLGRAIAYTSATGLVVASAGFGGVYAWTTGNRHGPLLGGLAVLMALSLEMAKPLALAQALEALRRWRLPEALGLAALAAVAIVYSLTAELSLTATLRADATAERAAHGRTAAAAATTYSRLEAQLVGVAPARPSAELQAEIGAIDSLPGIRDESGAACGTIDGRVTKAQCPRRAALLAELARAEERQRLESALSVAAAAMTDAGAETKPDAGAAALSAYLGLFGVTIGAGLLSELLVLAVVLALEVGSAMAAVLAGSFDTREHQMSGHARTVDERLLADARNRGQPRTDIDGPTMSVDPQVSRPVDTRGRAEVAIVDKLCEAGGRLDTGTARGLATLIGGRKSTVHNALVGLLAAGIVTKAGGALVLRG